MQYQKGPSILHWLAGSFLFSIFPLYSNVLWWLFILAPVLYYWRTRIEKSEANSIAKKWKVLIVLSSIGLFLPSVGGEFSLQTFISLLVLAACLKLMELEARRDYYLFVFLGCFISASQLLFNNDVLSFAYSLFCFFLFHLCLLKVNYSARLSNHARKGRPKTFLIKEQLAVKKVAVIFLQTIPIAIVLFLVMPRIGSLWKMPLNNTVAKTGISDELSIGDIGRLNQDHSVAMRVTFHSGDIPEASNMYWRGLLLTYFDGSTWHRKQDNEVLLPINNRQSNDLVAYSTSAVDEVNYSVMLESSGRPWLYALNTPRLNVSELKKDKKQWSDFSFSKNSSVLKRYQYKVTSYSHYSDRQALTSQDFDKYTSIPLEGNFKSRAFAKKLVAIDQDPKAVVANLMEKFNQEFSYTLEPGRLSASNAIDDFMFDTLLGYCEHFASSTVFILRAAGIPARIATGYQGGQWSENKEYLMVTQADAHAWAEVWYEGEGWTRVDPTAFVAPERTEQGANSFLRQLNETNSFVARFNHSSLLQEWRKNWDNVNYQWHRWVLGYDNNIQVSFVKKLLGGLEPWRIGGFILLPFILLLLPFLINYLIKQYVIRRNLMKDPLIVCINKLSSRLSKFGVQREKGETIARFLERAQSQYPEKSALLYQINQQLNTLLYNPNSDKTAVVKDVAFLIKKL